MSPELLALLEHARPLSTSDLFISEGRRPYVRTSAQLREIARPAMTRQEVEEIFHTCGCDPSTTLDSDRSLEAEGMRFRVNLHRRDGKLAAVLRHVRSQIPTMETLGLPEELLTRWLSKQSGLILVSGATGSGKSTTLASSLEWINNRQARHIVTIEDPVEYVFEDRLSIFTQRQVRSDTESFSEGLRGALRQSPDVIFIGEIRDRETATIALQAAETGQLVVSSMQSLGVQDTIYRLLNLFPEHDRANAIHLFASQLLGILCQQLLPGAEEGLFLALEYVENEGAIREWIREADAARVQDFIHERPSENSLTFLDSLIHGCRQGYISYETGLASCGNELEFNRALRGIASA